MSKPKKPGKAPLKTRAKPRSLPKSLTLEQALGIRLTRLRLVRIFKPNGDVEIKHEYF